MIQECKYNPIKDIQAVSQTGFIDLAECFANGNVPSNIDDVEVNYNGIEDPSSILGKPRDVFEAARMMSYIAETGKKGESVVADA